MIDFNYAELVDALEKMAVQSLSLSRVISVLATLAACLIVTKLVCRLTERLLKNPHFSPKVQKYVLNGVKGVMYLVSAILVASSAGVPVGSLVYLIGVIGLVIYLAVQDILGNVAGGLVILFAKPFLTGDYIESDIGTGTVTSIDIVYTKLTTYEGQQVSVPNSKLSSSKIINYTRLGTRRIDIPIHAPYAVPAEKVRRACLAAVAVVPNILPDPIPKVTMSEFEDRAIQYYVRCWTNVDTFWDCKFALMEQLQTCMAEAGIAMDYNHVEVEFKGEEGARR